MKRVDIDKMNKGSIAKSLSLRIDPMDPDHIHAENYGTSQ